VLVAGNQQNPADCLEAVEQYLRQGITADLLHSRSFLSRRRLWQTVLGAGLGFALLGSLALIALPDLFAGVVERQIVPLRERGSVLPKIYHTTEKMALAQKQAAQATASKDLKLKMDADFSRLVREAHEKFASQIKEAETSRLTAEKVYAERKAWEVLDNHIYITVATNVRSVPIGTLQIDLIRPSSKMLALRQGISNLRMRVLI
jgi:hypothetical protein